MYVTRLRKNQKYDTMKFAWEVQNQILIPIFYTRHFAYSLWFMGTDYVLKHGKENRGIFLKVHKTPDNRKADMNDKKLENDIAFPYIMYK